MWKYGKNDDMPSIINVEVLRGECPCKCVHCPVGIKEVTERKDYFSIKHMRMDIFRKICDELAEKGVGTIRIHSVGEPLLWNNLSSAIDYAKEKNIVTWIFTSLVTNDEILLRKLCEKVSIIEVSVNATEEKDYFEKKGIDAFSVVKRNIEFMSAYIKDRGLKTRLIVSRVQSDDLLKDQEFVLYWEKSNLVDDAFVRTYHTYNNLLENITDEELMRKEPCRVHWKRFNISIDGLAVVCFNELFKRQIEAECILGDVSQQSIHEIWNSEYMQRIRKADYFNKFEEEKFSNRFPCVNCLNCQGGQGKVTSEHQIEQFRK